MNCDDFLAFVEAMRELKERDEEGWTILVEGVKDAEALARFGISNVFVFSSFRDAAEKLEGRRIVILTDFDRRGEQIERRLREIFANADTELRKKIFVRIRREVTKVEELSEFYERYAAEFGVVTDLFFQNKPDICAWLRKSSSGKSR